MTSLNPSSKMIIEIRINESLCDTERDDRLSKEMITYQLGKCLERKLDSSTMNIVMCVVRGMSKPTVINMHNFQDLRLYKSDVDEIKKITRDSLNAYLSNPSEFIAQNRSDDSKAGGALYKLLTAKGAALENKDNQSRYETEALTEYSQSITRYNAFRLTVELNKKLKEHYPAYHLVFVTDTNNPFKPHSYIQMMRYDKPLMWLRMDIKEEQVNSIIRFVEGFAGLSYMNTINGAKRKICEFMDAEEHLQDFDYQSTLIENNAEYDYWANPKISEFLEQLQAADENASEDSVPFYADDAWVYNLTAALQTVFQEESKRAKMVVVNKILVT